MRQLGRRIHKVSPLAMPYCWFMVSRSIASKIQLTYLCLDGPELHRRRGLLDFVQLLAYPYPKYFGDPAKGILFVVFDLQGEVRSQVRLEGKPNFRRPIVFNSERIANFVHVNWNWDASPLMRSAERQTRNREARAICQRSVIKYQGDHFAATTSNFLGLKCRCSKRRSKESISHGWPDSARSSCPICGFDIHPGAELVGGDQKPASCNGSQ